MESLLNTTRPLKMNLQPLFLKLLHKHKGPEGNPHSLSFPTLEEDAKSMQGRNCVSSKAVLGRLHICTEKTEAASHHHRSQFRKDPGPSHEAQNFRTVSSLWCRHRPGPSEKIPYCSRNNTKNWQTGQHEPKKLLERQGNKAARRRGEKLCFLCFWQRVSIKNVEELKIKVLKKQK